MHAHSTNRTPAKSFKAAAPAIAGSVRGSLDPPARSKKTAKTGWRYIQCTDTPDELRVLLPPRPAAIYANLLKVEAHTLAKNDADSENELLYIRQLKEAMVTRCQKLAQDVIHAASESQVLRSGSVVEAPIDFKSKRLEQWWARMEGSGKVKTSSHSKHQAHAELQSRTQPSSSISTISPSKSRVHVGSVAYTNQANAPQATMATQPHYDAESSMARKNRPTPLTVPPAGHTTSAQSSPSIPRSVPSPNRSSKRHSVQLSPQVAQGQPPYVHPSRPHLRHAGPYKPVYTNDQMASPMGTPHNPYFDPNQSLASQQHQSSPYDSRNTMAVDTHSPYVGRRIELSSLTNDPRMNKRHVYSAVDARTEPAPSQTDPSHLKSRFHATYASSASNSISSPSSNGSKPLTYAPQDLPSTREYAVTRSQFGSGQPSHPRPHASFSLPPQQSSPVEKDHRRRATVDCDDTDRSVPRPKGYMYSADVVYNKAHDGSPETYHNGYHYGAQVSRQANDDHSPSALRHVSRVLNQSLTSAGSPISSTGSSHSHGSPRTQNAADGSLHSQSSPSKGSFQARNYGATLSVEQRSSYVNGGSPNLLAAPALSRSRRSSNESAISASNLASSAQGDGGNAQPKQQLRRTTSRRALRDRSPGVSQPSNAQIQAVLPDPNYYAAQRSLRRTTVAPPDLQQQVQDDGYQRGRTRREESSPHRRYGNASPRRPDAVIPDMAIWTPMTSKRNSRYTSGDSSVSEPVIPDVSLIVEAELSRKKADRVRRRLVPFQSSSEEAHSPYHSEFDDSDLSSSGEDEGNHGGGYYKPPYRTRDGYGSGYASETGGTKSRPVSRPPSRPPSRGILKRSSSMCSQRSSKSVRLEIPKDRRALEEVRDAEDKVERAQKSLEDMQRRKGSRTKGVDADIQKATESLDQAKKSLKEKEGEYQTILQALKLKHSEQDEMEARYV